jgi:hypothetical protein
MHTMNRCTKSRSAIAAFLTSLFLFFSFTAAIAQGFVREAPRDVVLGRMLVQLPPVITLNGKPDRLSPGSRIRDLNNMLALSGSLVNKDLPILYRRDAAGLVSEVWLLTEPEYAKLGGANVGTPEGVKMFADLLALVFGARR